ncbi:choline dehydrogenase 6 [Entomortierella lignicola]|nr:choline dehydrogenase 6 [Entomortierella lignicola]
MFLQQQQQQQQQPAQQQQQHLGFATPIQFSSPTVAFTQALAFDNSATTFGMDQSHLTSPSQSQAHLTSPHLSSSQVQVQAQALALAQAQAQAQAQARAQALQAQALAQAQAQAQTQFLAQSQPLLQQSMVVPPGAFNQLSNQLSQQSSPVITSATSPATPLPTVIKPQRQSSTRGKGSNSPGHPTTATTATATTATATATTNATSLPTKSAIITDAEPDTASIPTTTTATAAATATTTSTSFAAISASTTTAATAITTATATIATATTSTAAKLSIAATTKSTSATAEATTATEIAAASNTAANTAATTTATKNTTPTTITTIGTTTTSSAKAAATAATTTTTTTNDDSDSESGSSSSGGGSSSSSSGSSSSSESDQEFKGKTPPPTKKPTGRKKNTAKSGGNAARWAVPYDPVLVPMGSKTLEKILAWRNNNGAEELLIKYKFSSYLHVEWVPKKRIEDGEHLGKNRVKKFMEKNDRFSDYEFFNPAFTKVDRIIDEGELATAEGEIQIFFLVKWCNTSYDGSTWEKRDDVLKLDATKVHEFYARKIIPDSIAAKQLPRPPRGAFRKLKESPLFKHGNQLRQYQMEGLNWLLDCWFNGQACIMADEMGLGKTVQSVTFLNEIHNTYHIRGPFLVIAPLSTIPHWHREFEAWTEMNVVVFHGNIPSRNLIVDTEYYYKDAQGQIVPNLYKFDVLITTYEMIVAASAMLKPVAWRAIVVDEAHRLKNSASKVSEILKTYSLEHRVLLTGTPLQNSLDELFALLNFLEPTRFANEKAFLAEYGNLKTAAEVDKLQQLLKPLMLRRFKEDVEKSIPVKEETIIEVELTTTQKAFYRAILEKNFGFLKKGGAAGPSLINIMMELRKCCIHPYLIAGAEDRIVSEKHATTVEAQYQCLIDASGKLVLIDKLLKKLKEGGHKVLIFSQMTRCLDLLQDYLRGRAYPYERIDGSIRGDMRQAAIDRFSTTPDSFVFLLCTRAGGVGINLTAADTVVIFDSDWNPQNDLQATARCHRIGQTKPVQIYRLVTRNTYEKEMFDRASIKLGLDKAVLQKMDVMPSSDDLSDMPKPPSSLSKKEVEELLKKGAYGALLDDDETSAKFCEEDIDQILERRTTVIKHTGNEKGSVFSKATFSSTPSGEEVDVNDPKFWDKWAERANVDIQDITAKDQLIINAPRSRRQVQRFGKEQGDSDSEDRDYVSDPDFEDAKEDKDSKDLSKKREAPRPWSMAEKLMFERKLMIYGYGRWDQMRVFFPRRTEKDLNAVGHCMVQQILRDMASGSEDDRKLIEEIEAVLVESDASSGYEAPSTNDVPFDKASKKSTIEFRSFLLDATQDYVEHIRRKGRNLVLRVQLIHTIRNLIPRDWNVAKQIVIPPVSGVPPASWWGEDEDRDLMLAIIKYGYLVTEAQYDAVRKDPEFCFYGRRYDLNANRDANDDEDEDNSRQSRHTNSGSNSSSGSGEVLPWPSKSDTGLRLRRILSALQRQHQIEQRKSTMVEKDKTKEKLRQDRQRQREEAALEKKHQKVIEIASRWTKKDKGEFYKTITSFGVVRIHNATLASSPNPDTPNSSYSTSGQSGRSRTASSISQRRQTKLSPIGHDWSRFKELAGLTKKPDEVMEEYYHHFVKVCQQVVDKSNNSVQNRQSRESSMSSSYPKTEAPSSIGDDEDEKEDKDDNGGDVPPLDRAKRVLKRVELMNIIRDEILTNIRLDDLLAAGRRSPGLPSWWITGIHDRPFLEGLARHGINRQDLIVEDEDLPFAAISRHYAALQKERLEKKADLAENPNLDIMQQDSVENAVKAATLADQLDDSSETIKRGSSIGMSELVNGTKMEDADKEMPYTQVEVKDEPNGTVTSESKDDVKTVLEGVKSEAINDGDIAMQEPLAPKQDVSPSSNIAVAKGKPVPPPEPEEFIWLKEAVVLRRVDHLIDIVLHPKPVSKKKKKHHEAQMLLNSSSPAAASSQSTRDKEPHPGDDDESEAEPSERDDYETPPIPDSPVKKRRGRGPAKEKRAKDPITGKPSSSSLVTISKDGKDDSTEAKPSGLKLMIKLKMPTSSSSSSASKSAGAKKAQPPVSKRAREDEDNKDSKSSGSDTDEMMAIASKQVEYLQRKINEKKLQRASSPATGGVGGGGSSSSKPKANPGGMSKTSSPMRSTPPPPSTSRQSRPVNKSKRRRPRSISASSSSGSSRSSRSSSSRSSSRSSSSSSRSGSVSSSGSESYNRDRRRGRDPKRRRRQSTSRRRRSRTRSYSRSISRSRSRPRYRSRSRLASISRSRSRSVSRSRSRSRLRSRTRSRSHSRSQSPPVRYGRDSAYHGSSKGNKSGLSSSSSSRPPQASSSSKADQLYQQRQKYQENVHQKSKSGGSNSYQSGHSHNGTNSSMMTDHYYQQSPGLPLTTPQMSGSISNGKRKSSGVAGNPSGEDIVPNRREEFSDDDEWYRKKSKT